MFIVITLLGLVVDKWFDYKWISFYVPLSPRDESKVMVLVNSEVVKKCSRKHTC